MRQVRAQLPTQYILPAGRRTSGLSFVEEFRLLRRERCVSSLARGAQPSIAITTDLRGFRSLRMRSTSL
jgi:hypothetical protein